MTLATRTTSQNRLLFRHKLARVFRESKVITGVWADVHGNVGNTTATWETYWGIGEGGDLPSSVRASLEMLRGAWSQYIASNFSAELAVPFCHAYFHLLRAAIDVHEQGSRPWSADLLQKVLGFESFHVICPHVPGALAAGTTTIRNPIYLLAKLREPFAYDDPKFLPILRDNQSIFSVLAHMARLVVTEDVDLGPEQLHNHLEKFNLMDLAASDATDHVRMQSAHLLCITARQNAKSLPGKRLW